jgi:hypothetical protein
MATAEQTTQVTIRELTDFCGAIVEGLRRDANGAQMRPAVEGALSAECVQCGIRLGGAELLKLGEAPVGEVEGVAGGADSRVERLRTGYCARNGCESHYYRLTRGAVAGVDWEKLAGVGQEVASDAQAEVETAGAQARKLARRHWNLLRVAAALVLLLIAIVIRQIYLGGTIPFLREPENFQVDRGE